MVPLILFNKHEDMLIVFNILLCDCGNEMLTDIIVTKHVRSRNKNASKDKAKVMKIFFSVKACCVIYFTVYNYFHSMSL